MTSVSPSIRAPGQPSQARAWLLAARPATLTAALGPVAVGTALAASDGASAAGPALAALFGAVFIQIATNFFNDWADFRKGADGEDRVGPTRAAQAGWLSEGQVLAGGLLASALAVGFGAYLTYAAGPVVVVIGIASLLSGFLYTAGPFPLGYHGLGDLFVLAFFGVVAVTGTYYVQALEVSSQAFLAGGSLGCLATAILVVNNLRDRYTDLRAGKRTLAVRFGARFTRLEYQFLLLCSYVLIIVGAFAFRQVGWLLPLTTVPLAVRRMVAINSLDGAELNHELRATAQFGLLFSLLLAAGVLL